MAIVLDNCKGDDREEYARNAARERKRKLEVSFGENLRNVALEPGCRTACVPLWCESGSKCPRLIPVSGSKVEKSASLSDK